MKRKKCERVNCGQPAMYQGRITVFTAEGTMPAVVKNDMLCCLEHGNPKEAASLMTPMFRRRIAGELGIIGKRPDWNRSYAEWIPISPEDGGIRSYQQPQL